MLSLIVHAVGVESYLALTQGGANRLRIESYRWQRVALDLRRTNSLCRFSLFNKREGLETK